MPIHVSGNLFLVNGVRKSIVTRTSFCLLGHYQSGNRDKGRRWLDRIQAQGFDGPRLFGENQDWFPGDAFFGTSLTPRINAFPNHSGPFSELELIEGYEELIIQLAQDLIARDMIAEFTCVATIKGREPGWTGQGLNKFAQLFRQLFREGGDTPFLHETINEWDAHSVYASDPEEIARMGGRWRRGAPDSEHYNYPGSTIGVSAGGQWSPGFDDRGYTHRNIHPPRGARWAEGENGEPVNTTIGRILANNNGRPLYLNETVHYMSQAQWDEWIPKIDKWPGLSTTNHERLVQYILDVRAAGASVNFHDLNGMMTDPDQPLTIGEEAITDALGGVTPPPQPSWVRPIVGMVRRGYGEILERTPDPDGLRHYHDRIKTELSEADFRNTLLRSPEFRDKFGL